MNKRIPRISYEKKVCIICEGYEEYDYIEKIISLNVWHKAYKFYPVNAESNGNIPARYQDNTINIENYNLMKQRASMLPTDDTMMGSSNWGSVLNYFSSEDANWIENINRSM